MTDSTYAMFLTHFGVLIILNAYWEQMEWNSPWGAVAMVGVGLVLSNMIGWAFHNWAEKPIIRFISGKSTRSLPSTQNA
jgi:peptidoglycan/LPS O-acetylase OafA/YrhL